MHTDFLIIGQGISGTFLSWFLTQKGISNIVVDEYRTDIPSRVAAGLINPVTGRRVVKSWKIDELMPFAEKAYTALGKHLGVEGIRKKSIIDFFPNEKVLNNFREKIAEGIDYIHMHGTEDYRSVFNYDFGYGVVTPAYIANLREILPLFRRTLLEEGRLLEDVFDHEQLEVTPEHIRYKDITARYIIYCEGAHGYFNPYFGKLPFALNKGQALIIKVPGLPPDNIYKKTHSIIHLYDDYFWIGGGYEWEFKDSKPTDAFRQQMENFLKGWLKLPFEIIEHKAAVRPATVERRPFAGMHPVCKNIGILNGMGTKGCSLAPYFSLQLIEHILEGKEIEKEASVNRFDHLLARTISEE